MHADNRRVDHLHGSVMRGGQRIHNLAPDARLSPANDAIVAGGVWTKDIRQVPPRCPGPRHLKDAAEDTAVIHTRHAARFVRQERLDGDPFMVGEFIAHDSKLPVLKLESRGYDRSQVRIRGETDIDWQAKPFVSVENDPTRKCVAGPGACLPL
jgi:hypothetical protein